MPSKTSAQTSAHAVCILFNKGQSRSRVEPKHNLVDILGMTCKVGAAPAGPHAADPHYHAPSSSQTQTRDALSIVADVAKSLVNTNGT